VNPAILFPAASPLEVERVKAILTHEVAHVKRGDCAWHLLSAVLCAVLFFQPLVWLVTRRLELANDEVCDDYVLQAGHSARLYASQLVDAAERYQVCVFSSRCGSWHDCHAIVLAGRVKRLLKREPAFVTACRPRVASAS